MPMTTEPEFGTPDEISPEWAAYESRWSVRVSDFASPLEAAKFLARRKVIFAATEKSGFPKEMLAKFGPDKPGFEDRMIAAIEALLQSTTVATRHAAE